MNGRGSPDAWQCGADGAAEGGVSFVAQGRAGGGDAVLRLGDGDEGRWLGGTSRPTVRGGWVSECTGARRVEVAVAGWRAADRDGLGARDVAERAGRISRGDQRGPDVGCVAVLARRCQGVEGEKETAEKRNSWILDRCDEAVFASLDPNGSLARLVAARPHLRYQVL